MFGDLPVEPADRLAQLEELVETMRQDLHQLRRRGASVVHPPPVRWVRTAETAAGYPAIGQVELPIMFLDAAVAVGGESITTTNGSANARITAVSRFGWLPPELDCEAVWDGVHWRIISTPPLIHGYLDTELEAAEWNYDCDEYTLGGSENLHVYRLDDYTGTYQPQYYSSGSEVYLPVKNSADAVAENKLLTVGINSDGEWTVIVESCSVSC